MWSKCPYKHHSSDKHSPDDDDGDDDDFLSQESLDQNETLKRAVEGMVGTNKAKKEHKDGKKKN